ncbi:MAG: DUF6390 family protein [Candidatus Woesearchaeota archaeon]
MSRGLELCIRFSAIPNAMRYCGPDEAIEPFRRFLVRDPDFEFDDEQLAGLLERFEGLYPYLAVIAQRNGIDDPFDERVVEAYWIGNDLLDTMTPEDYIEIIERLSKRGLPSSFAGSLIEDLPEGLIPHHNAHVCYVGPGRTAHTVRATIETMDRCRIAPAKVLNVVDSNHLLAEQRSLCIEHDRFVLSEPETRTIVYDARILKPCVGDVVAAHWGTAATILSQEQHKNLAAYDEMVRDAIAIAQPDE